MKKEILIFDDEKNIRLSKIDNDYGRNFELTDENMQHCYFTENQLKLLKEMIEEMLQTINKKDW
jgi:hypothetical protein